MKSATGLAHGVVGILIVTMAMVANADTFYVNGSCGNDDWTGTSSVCEAPNGPKLTIQAGIDASVGGDTVIVADGTYTGAGNKNLDFGGRAISVGSEGGPAACIIDCEDDGRGFWFHNGETADAVLEGFTIRNGLVAGNGGAILCESASPTVTNCTFSGNVAGRGGGMFNQNSSPTVSDCTFATNTATGKGGGGMFNDRGSSIVSNCTFIGNTAEGLASFDGGGGIFNGRGSNPTITGCAFDSNTGVFWGGAMVNENNDVTVIDCLFLGNSVTGENSWGGAIANSTSPSRMIGCTFVGNTSNRQGGAIANLFGAHVTISNCVFIENTAEHDGGGMNNRDTSSPAITNCTFAGNTGGSQGGALFINRDASPIVTNCTLAGNSAAFGGGMFSSLGTVIANSVLWDNSPDQIGGTAGDVTYSCVQGGWPGPGNIDADPLFVDPANGEYRLSADSPCIDAADNTAVPKGIETDLDGNPRFVDDPETADTGNGDPPIVDMGAYEFQACDPCDMNCDGDINAFDIEPFLDLLFGPDPQFCNTCTGDANGDGNVDAFDIEPFLNCLFP